MTRRDPANPQHEGETLPPDTPTTGEAGVRGADSPLWFGVWAPAGTPGDVMNKLSTDIRRAVWRKLIRNAATNVVSALTGATLEQLGHDEEAVRLVTEIALEGINPAPAPSHAVVTPLAVNHAAEITFVNNVARPVALSTPLPAGVIWSGFTA
mgnify:CR=1 FL=1